MNDTLKVAGRIGAELGAAKAENDRLRGLLRECRPAVQREVEKWTRASAILPVNANAESALLSRIDAALSQQARPAEAEGVEAVEFWVLFDATTPEPYIKKMMPEGFLAFFDREEDAIRAKSFHPGTDYKRVPYVRQSAHLAALSAVTAERDAFREARNCLIEENTLLYEQIAELIEERDQLRAESEALRADAERFRWLAHRGDACQWMNIIRVDPDDFESYAEAVDAAMAAKEA